MGTEVEFTLRPWRMSDAVSIARYANNKNIAQNLRDGFPHPYTHADALAFIEDSLRKDGKTQLIRAIVVEGEAVGSIGAFLQEDVYRKSAEIGYWLGEPFWGKGIMTEAIPLFCKEVFGKFDLVRLFAEPFAYNMGSRRALEKAGFTLEGTLRKSVIKNGMLFDSCIYALLR